LSTVEARRRLENYGPNVLHDPNGLSWFAALGRQLRSPLLLLLIFAASAAVLSGEWIDAAIVLLIVVMTVGSME
jgi:P-type Mg2+ transporter